MFYLVFLCYRFLSLAPPPGGAGLVLASDFQRTSLPSPLSSSPLPFRKRVQKYYLFPIPQALFSTIFFLFYISLDFNEKNLSQEGKHGDLHTLLYIIMRHQRGRKASSIWSIVGFPSLKTMEIISKRVLMSMLCEKI